MLTSLAEMAREASERMGSDTVMEATVSRPRFFASLSPSRQSESETARRRMLMLPQEINRMPREEMIVLRPGLMPLKLRRLFWYSDPAFRDRGGEPPRAPCVFLAMCNGSVEGKACVLRSAAYAAVVDWCPSDEVRGEVWWGASEVERPDMGCGA